MSLDWGRGFGTAFPENSPTEISQSLRNLCFVPTEEPPETPVRMVIDKRRVLCAQIPGILPEETYIIDLLAVDPVAGMVVVDFISAERQFVRDLHFLHQAVFPTLTNPNYVLVDKALDEHICLIALQHSKLTMEIENIVKGHLPNLIYLFVEKITSIPHILSSHENSMNDFVQHELMAACL
jgi:hypothetical protein